METFYEIREVVTSGSKSSVQIVEAVSHHEYGFFRDRKEAEERATELGETFYVYEVVGV